MYKPKKCRICGDVFVPKSARQLDCNKPIEKKCIVCGKMFKSKCSANETKKTCSASCTKKYAYRNS